MGRRELLIILAFIVAGVVSFQLLAPPAPEGQGFSFGRMFQSAQRNMRANSATASVTSTGAIAVTREMRELRLTVPTRGVRISAESRSDIGYELTVESSGPDTATAEEYARRSALAQDDLGDALALKVTYPPDARQSAVLVLRVPLTLAVRLERGNGTTIVTGVRRLELDNVGGTMRIENVREAVTGQVRNAQLVSVSGADSVALSLVSTPAQFTRVANGLDLGIRAGRCTVSESGGSLIIEKTDNDDDIKIESHRGPIRITGAGGRITIDRPQQETRVDVRRSEVEVTLDRAVPMALFTTDETLRLIVAGEPAVTIDALATEDGRIQGADFGVTLAETAEQRWQQAIGRGGPRVTLRNLRASIVIAKAK